MSYSVTVVVGNPRPRSRTRDVAVALAERLIDADARELTVVDLADHLDDVFVHPAPALDDIAAEVVASDLAIFASPTYKASHTGLLKAFLDRYPADALAGLPAIPVLTGADERHLLGASVSLAPLLAELGAVVPGRGFYFVTGDMTRLDEAVEEAARTYVRNIDGVSRLTIALTRHSLAAAGKTGTTGAS